MSEETWKYSLGKYLELSFYHLNISSRNHDCDHDIFKDFTRFFAFGDYTIRMHNDPIKIYEISTPLMRRKADSEVMTRMRISEQNEIQNQITEFYNSVLDRIESFTYDICPPDKISECKEILTDLSKKAKVDRKFMLQLLHQTQITALSSDYFALAAFYKSFLDSVRNWDSKFTNFIQNNLQTDAKDIRRRTAAQIKRIFVEKDPIPERTTVFGGGDVVKSESIQFTIDREKLPHLHNSFQAGIEETFTSALKRAISVQYGVPRQSIFPILHESPSSKSAILDSGEMELKRRRAPGELQSLHLTNSRSKIIFDEKITPVESSPRISLLSHGSYKADFESTFEHEWMYPRYTSDKRTISTTNSPAIEKTPFEAQQEEFQSSPLNPPRQVLVDEDSNAEINAITGVTAESDTLPRRIHDLNQLENRPTSLMQTITNLWTGNPANFSALRYPIGPGDHVFAGSNVIVRESEPSSIVAFTLSTTHYLEQLKIMRDELYSDDRNLETVSTKYSNGDENIDLEDSSPKEGGSHIRYQFWDGPTKMHCKIYFAEKFDTLRHDCGVDDIFEYSLSRCVKWEASGGKSGSTFLKTVDDRFVVKKISQTELEALIDFSPFYFEYMSKACFQKVDVIN